MKAFQITVLTYLVLFCSSATFAQHIILDHVDGLVDGIYLPTDTEIDFYIRIVNDSNFHKAGTSGFRIYSENGAHWTKTSADTVSINPSWRSMFDMLARGYEVSDDGYFSDSVAFAYAQAFSGTGLIPYFDQVAFKITIGPIPETDAGKTICLDSSFCPPTYSWKWMKSTTYPSWDGPHCFTVDGCDGVVDSDGDLIPDDCDECPDDFLNDYDEDNYCYKDDNCPELYNPDQDDVDKNGRGDDCCCVGLKGNIDDDLENVIDIGDLVMLVDYLFRNGPPLNCYAESDITGNGLINANDIIYLIDYQFHFSDAPPNCP